MGIKLAPEFESLATAAIGDTIDFLFDEVIDLLIYLPEGIATILDGLSSSWPVPGIFDDSIAIPHPLTKDSNGDWTTQTPAQRWFNDVDVSAYAPPNVPQPLLLDYSTNPPSAVTSVPGDLVGRNSFLGTIGFVLAALVGYVGVRKSSALVAKVYAAFFGLNAKLGGIEDKVDAILATLDLPSNVQETESGQPSDVVLEQFDVIKHILRNADSELSGLITGLLTNKRHYVSNEDWTEGVVDSRTVLIE